MSNAVVETDLHSGIITRRLSIALRVAHLLVYDCFFQFFVSGHPLHVLGLEGFFCFEHES